MDLACAFFFSSSGNLVVDFLLDFEADCGVRLASDFTERSEPVGLVNPDLHQTNILQYFIMLDIRK